MTNSTKSLKPATNTQIKEAFASGFVSAEMAIDALNGSKSARKWVTEAIEHYKTEK